MKTAIVYYSGHHGNTKKLVEAIAKQILTFAEKYLPEDKKVFFINTCGFQSPVLYFDAVLSYIFCSILYHLSPMRF